MMLDQQKMLKREMDSFFLIPIIHMKITVSRFFLGWQCYITFLKIEKIYLLPLRNFILQTENDYTMALYEIF